MLKMLLVEDEPATIEGIKSAINWPMIGISICGEATNGLEAIQMIDDLEPDIILCDIRMPKMDGISLINQIQPRHPNIKVIFLSGYSDKEYLKSAIRLNVVDYIYKPFELGELIQAIEKAKAACKKEHDSESVSEDNDIALNIIQKGWASASSLKDIPLDLDELMATIIIHFNSGIEVAYETEAFTISRYLPEFKRAFSQIFNNRYIISCINNAYILHANVPTNFASDKNMITQLNELFATVKNFSGAIAVGISNPVPSFEHLRESYHQARNAVLSAFLVGYGKLIFYKDLSTAVFTPRHDLEEMFFNPISNNNIASSIDFLEEYVSYMRSCRPEDIPAIKDELAAIAFQLNQKSKKQDHIQRRFITETINYALEIEDIKQYLLQMLEQIQGEINNLDNKGRIIFDVEKYIIQNYDKNLSINQIAEHVYLTPTYLCHLYKKTTGRTLNQFILDVKMNKSKRLLTDTTLKISEIAEKIGYTNQNYFTRTFTKYFGLNPTTFRNKFL
jgi:two-component system response regulator YesN